MVDRTSSNINNVSESRVKCIITIGNLSVIPLDNSIKKSLGITDDTVFSEEITEDGILLRPIKGSDYFDQRATRANIADGTRTRM